MPHHFLVEDFIVSASWDAFPKPVKEHAVKCLLDLIGVFCAGAKTEPTAKAAQFAKKAFVGNDATVLSIGGKANLIGAAMANASCANALDLDDGYSLTKGHPGSAVIGGLLAAAEYAGCTYREFLTALVVGYELTMRQGLAIQDYYQYYHSTGAYAAFGTAGSVGRLLGLDQGELFHALAIADYFAPVVPCMRSVEVPSMNKDGIYLGAQLGMQAALLAKDGVTGCSFILGDEQYLPMAESLGKEFKFFELYYKFYACCRWAQPAVCAAVEVQKRHKICPGDIVSIDVTGFSAAGALYDKAPKNPEEAQYNISYPVAAALVRGDCGPREAGTDAMFDLEVVALMPKIKFSQSAEFEAQFPAKRFSEVTITTKDGGSYSSGPCEARGDRSTEVPLAELKQKFIDITRDAILENDADMLMGWILSTDYDRPARELVTMIDQSLRKGANR